MDERPRAMNQTLAWEAVLQHDRRWDGIFVYGVASTGIYCRPSCPSRRPSRRQVTFFRSPRLAETAGFRACLRCRPESADASKRDRQIVRARHYLEGHSEEPVTLAKLAAEIGVSPSHLQRTFTHVVGLSPKQFHTMQRMAHFKTALQRGRNVTHAIYEAGFGSSSRLYERVAAHLGMTPSMFQSGGAGACIRFTIVPTAVGRMLVAVTDRGVATVRLGSREDSLIDALRQDYPSAALRRDSSGLQRTVNQILHSLDGKAGGCRLVLDLDATAFQRRVWRALLRIPYGRTSSYREVARAIGKPKAARAVARACATNPIAIAIPCHRVVRTNGQLGGYRWGLQRKQRLLALERQPAE